MPPKNPTTETLPTILPSDPEFKTTPFSSRGSSSYKGKSAAADAKKSSVQERITMQSCVGERTAATNAVTVQTKSEGAVEDGVSVRDSLKRHQMEIAGRVWIPEIWGQEDFLKDWIDCSAFDTALIGSRIVSARAALVEEGIVSARAALVEEGRRASSGGFRIENSSR